jgi:phosphopantothenoylcysteine decarboxylase/phosphopantothenate--cysteine ligase
MHSNTTRKQMIEEIRGKLGEELINKNIIHCVTSSVSLYKAIDISRYLIKHGANVIPVLSNDAKKLISPYLFEFATGNKPITKITGKIEHVEIFKRYKIDAVLIAPATFNTINKIANGIADTTVTLFASIAISKRIPIVIAPAMHEPMFNNPILIKNIEKLKEENVYFVQPIIEEEKAKIASENDILAKILFAITKKELKGKRILVTAGATKEYIDDIRYITNPSSGKMGIAMANEAYYRGGNVTLIHGEVKVPLSNDFESIYVETASEMHQKVMEIISKEKFDFFIASAAVTDYTPVKKYDGKISTKIFSDITLQLKLTPRIIRKVKEISPETKLVAFKAEYGIQEDKIQEIVSEYEFADFIIINDVSRKDIGFGSDFNEIYFFDGKEVTKIEKTLKTKIAKIIWDRILMHT